MSGGWHRVERSYGAFERVFTLPETVDPEAVKADYKNGMLTITLPKKEVAKPRQIKIQSQQATKQSAGQCSGTGQCGSSPIFLLWEN